MTSSFDAYSCILHVERSLKPYVQASYNYSNFHFCGTLPSSMGRASPACPRRGCWGLFTEPTPCLPSGEGSSILGLDCHCWASKGRCHSCCRSQKKNHLLFLRFFPRGLAAPLDPDTIEGEKKMPLNLATADLSIFLPPTNPAQPLMSRNWLLSAPNHFSEVRINF